MYGFGHDELDALIDRLYRLYQAGFCAELEQELTFLSREDELLVLSEIGARAFTALSSDDALALATQEPHRFVARCLVAGLWAYLATNPNQTAFSYFYFWQHWLAANFPKSN